MPYPKKKNDRRFDFVRAAAVKALVLIEQGEQTDIAVTEVMSEGQFRPIDRRFLMQLVNGATKMRRRLDYELKFYLSRPSADLPLKLSNILRLGLYQLRFTDRIPAAAAVSESVNLAKHMTDKSRSSLVNAVLRASIREPDKVRFAKPSENPVKYLGEFYSYPDHFIEYCLREFGFEATEKLLQAYNEPPSVTYRVNYLKSKPDEVARILQDNNIDFSYGKYLPEFIHVAGGGLPLEDELIKTGKVFVQCESSGLPVRLLNPRPNSNVIDLTAAPGGKSTYMAIRMRNRGRVTALDKSHQRLTALVENAQRLGIKIIAPVACDMIDFDGGEFDRVLLDPPCSGWGTAGKNSDLRWSKSPEDTVNLAKIQRRMIDKAAALVKPGGVLVYSTCTIIRDENDQIIEEFLLRNKEFEIDSAAEFFGEDLVNERGFVKTYPNHPELDGSFCARLKRKLR
ncbi:MAG TPA: 16S rRNA (cytosine(967)-C(5))-methyltransferase RsmB [candidate division Zixibacteria bacterium]|nr:16S rRNA (cytosine(967)-C(5))-methyltransferase RsmB [candidate division Zixibacteria bacterium]